MCEGCEEITQALTIFLLSQCFCIPLSLLFLVYQIYPRYMEERSPTFDSRPGHQASLYTTAHGSRQLSVAKRRAGVADLIVQHYNMQLPL